MLHRKLLEILARLAPSEHRQLRLFLQSPYFTQGANQAQLLLLYDLIMQNGADEEDQNLSKEAVFYKLFPNKTFHEKEKSNLDSLSSELFRIVRRFLYQQEVDKDIESPVNLVSLLQFYRKNGLEERFWQTVATARKQQEGVSFRGPKYYIDQFRIEEEVSNFQGTFNTHEDDANLKNVHQNLDSFFSILKLEYACALKHRQKTSHVAHPPSDTLTNTVLSIVENEDYLKNPLNIIYSKIFLVLQGKQDADTIEDLRVAIEKEGPQVPPDKFRDILAYYRAFLTWTYVRSGKIEDLSITFDAYSANLHEGYLYIDNKLTPMALRVLCNMGLKLQKFPWVKKLLDEHPPERICGTKYPVEAHSLNVAEYHFHKKEYAEAEAKLTYRAFENPNFSITADLLLIKIYYETESELLESRMKALEQKVRRSKISAETKTGYYNFLKKLDKVVKYGWQKPSPKRDKLVQEIKTAPSVFAREWLLEILSS